MPETTVIADELVRRLRATGGKGQGGPIKAAAAKEIERLRLEIHELKGDRSRLLGALRSFGHAACNEASKYD